MDQPTPVIQPVSKPNILKPILIGFGIFIFLTSLATAGYLYAQNRNLKQQLALSPSTPAPQPTIIPTDPTVTWKSYQDPLYHYSVKYPSNWTTSPYGSTQKNSPTGEKIMFIQTTFMNECMSETSTETRHIEGKNFTLKYFTGVNTGEACSDSEVVDFNEIWVVSPTQDYGFVFQYPKALKTSSELIFTQILSTFKFNSITRQPPAGHTLTPCLPYVNPCDPSSCDYNPSQCNQ